MQTIGTNFWKNKKVLITGHTGFKGSWLCIYLLELGAEICGYSLDSGNCKGNFILCGLDEKILDIRGDIRDLAHLESVFLEYQPEIVFHMAAQPLVRESYESPKYTYECNVMGTLNILEAVRKTESVKTAIMITTDKCYENKETTYAYKETDPFGGYDPYSSSKACAEILIASYRNSFINPLKYSKHCKGIASVRAGNVIGGGDWAKDRIIPDCIRAIEEKNNILVRNPKAVRPWQHVMDALSGYLILAEKLYASPTEYAQGWNFGPEQNGMLNVSELASYVTQFYGEGNIIYGQESNTVHEAYLLNLDINKAKERLGWKPILSAKKAVELTVDWYKRYRDEDAYSICREHIKKYCLHWNRDYTIGNLPISCDDGASSKSEYEKIAIGGKRFVFDIDGVIAKIQEQNNYALSEPNYPMIQVVNKLHSMNNKIVLYTARGYTTGINWKEITEKQMEDWGVCYDELHFGKPNADYYIDDKMISIKYLLENFSDK